MPHVLRLVAATLLCGVPPLTAGDALSQASRTDLERGEQLFQRHCAACHGPAGEGGRGPSLAVAPLPRAPDDESLIKVIREGIEGTQMPRARVAPDEVRQIAAWVRQLGEVPRAPVPGDEARGRELYYGKGACSGCHAIRGHGGAFGPDLSVVGRQRGPAYLRRALTQPGAEVPKSFSFYRSDVPITQNFLQVRVLTRSGQRLLGVRVNEDTFSIQIRDAANRLHSFLKSELLELDKDWGKSPMPAYAGVFSEAELDDLVAFLTTLRND